MILAEKYGIFRKRVQEFAQNEVASRAGEIDERGEFPWDLVKRMAELELFGLYVPEKYGGAGLDVLTYAIAVEEIGRVCGSTGIFLAAHSSLGVYPLFVAGTEEQKQKYLIPMVRGEKIGSFGLTEPNAGSDAAGTETIARLEGDCYVVNGAKRFITSGGIADIIVLTATKDRKLGYGGISAFILEKGMSGFSAGKEEDKLGLRGSITSELVFEDCRIPKENLLGTEGEGFKVFMATLDGGRISIGALALGIAQGALDASVKFTREQRRGSTPLYKSQDIQNRIAEMATEIAAARHLIYHAAMLKDQGAPYTKEAAMGKYYASRIGMKATSTAIDLHGMFGLTREYPVERFMRDEKLMEIGEGTSEIQKIVIARQVLGK